MKLHEGDVVQVIKPGKHFARAGAIYDGIANNPWTRTSTAGEPEYRVYFDLDLDAGWFTSDQLQLVTPMPIPRYLPRDRVRITDAAHWAQGETATVDDDGMWRIVRHRSGPTGIYMVLFDHERDDGSGDGPYAGGEFSEAELELLES